MPEDLNKSAPAATPSFTEERNRRRSERVVLRVPIRLSAMMPDGKRVSIETRTLVVNAHGGLLDVGMEMIAGQQIRLKRPKMENATTGRVLRVEGSEEGRFLVAFEFETPSPNFWPVGFPPADWSPGERKA
jgi:hypothetical protein